MAICHYTAMLEARIERKIQRMQFCMMLDTFIEPAAVEGLEKSEDVIQALIGNMPNSEEIAKSYAVKKKKMLTRFKRFSKAKFIMGDYTEHLMRLTLEIQEIVNEIRAHDCGPGQHPENRPVGATEKDKI